MPAAKSLLRLRRVHIDYVDHAHPSTAAHATTSTPTSTSTSGGALQPNMSGVIKLSAPANGPANGVFPYFNLYTLDYENGVTLFPGFVQYATPGANVDLRAQVSGDTIK